MKINQLLQEWPRGTVAVSPMLAAHGVSNKLAEQYRKSGWIDSLGHGAFVRRGDNVTWHGAVYAMQKFGSKDIHPGGRTALELSGDAHYERLGRGTVHLFGGPGERLPVWFKRHDWGVDVRYTATRLFRDSPDVAAKQFGEYALRISSPERAIMEYLDGVPDDSGFDEAGLLMDGLSTLRPGLVDKLLEACTSIKVKRLFLYLADQSAHAWRKGLSLSRVDLGAGKRQIIKGGRLDPTYQITVPVAADTHER